HKLGIVLKELKESHFWILVISRIEMLHSKQVEPLIHECEELCAIIAKSIVTAKAKNLK
ncbi:four helix bundle protein, partial [bacterium]|nr:four helix bundle protein [bacterium]